MVARFRAGKQRLSLGEEWSVMQVSVRTSGMLVNCLSKNPANKTNNKILICLPISPTMAPWSIFRYQWFTIGSQNTQLLSTCVCWEEPSSLVSVSKYLWTQVCFKHRIQSLGMGRMQNLRWMKHKKHNSNSFQNEFWVFSIPWDRESSALFVGWWENSVTWWQIWARLSDGRAKAVQRDRTLGWRI